MHAQGNYTTQVVQDDITQPDEEKQKDVSTNLLDASTSISKELDKKEQLQDSPVFEGDKFPNGSEDGFLTYSGSSVLKDQRLGAEIHSGCDTSVDEKLCSATEELTVDVETENQMDVMIKISPRGEKVSEPTVAVTPSKTGSVEPSGVLKESADGFELDQSQVVSTPVSCCTDSEMGYKEVQITKSDKDTNVKIHDPNSVSMIPLEENQHTAANDTVLSMVSPETDNLVKSSANPLSRDVTPNIFSSGVPLSAANDISTASHSSDELVMNTVKENHNGAEELSGSVDKNSKGCSEENVDKGERESSHMECDVLNAVAVQCESGTVNLTADGALSRSTRKKLLVLDVNGLLADISSYVPYLPEPDEILNKKAVFKRPYCNDFLDFCLERFNVGLWSSRTRRNMEPIVDFLLGNAKSKVLFHWDQSHCTYTGFNTVEKSHKPLFVKKLKKLWDKYESSLPWEKGDYNESNTLLIDDSPYKAICNPSYTAIFPYTYRFRNVRDNSLGPGGDIRVYLERLAMADNVQEFVKENPFGQRAITEKNLSWGYYTKVIAAANTSPPRQNMSGQYPITENNRSRGYHPITENNRSRGYHPITENNRSRGYHPIPENNQNNRSWGYHPITENNRSWGYHPITENNRSWGYHPITENNQSWGYHSTYAAAGVSDSPRQNAEAMSNPWGVPQFRS